MTLRLALLTTTVTGAATLAALPAGAQSLTVFDYSGFEDPAFHSAYIEANGAGPDFAFFGDEEEAFQKLSSGYNEPGVTHICAGSVTKFVESGLIEPWDLSKITEWDNLSRDLTGQKVGDDGDVYFVPVDYGSTAIAYNADEVPAEDVASLDVFLNPEYQGRMSLPDNVDDAYALAYLATGTTDWSNATDAQFDAASEWLRKAHVNLRTYWTDPAELSQLLSSGEVLVSWAWNETLPTMADEGFPIGFQREAAEGSSLWLCGYVNMKDSTSDEQLGYDYVNAMLDASSTVPLLEAGYGQSNLPAMEGQGEEALTASGLGTIDAPVLAQLPMDGQLRQKQAETFERIKAGF
ncbi:MAG: ABC transporter substrate-binding protein [Jannaschia helgolandensis]|jgi:spermidine/putrescine transport system substrate-binding protein|uniref:Spermidine/putrescine transport system substrate-binding protein n=1 Tax=Jannaschia helgolandensis TaxID=188906 RepID=A0A1H7NLN7_9RHOB|nr:ABC transporter substrate-binding protein [Jannaschia helgolandensis]SEL23878.1 spermidine/putrescine transport system substrate-binding protein [Jannaschia helgolandensis]|tara:strand:+ start:1107 stop:2156 length:1050 start_codon:yes stop_codon:yes gene_type:complete